MAYLAKLARADAIAVILNLKGEGYATYVAHNLPTETKWSQGMPAAMLAKAMSERSTEQATSGVALPLSDGRLADTLAVSPVIRKERDPDQLLERATAQLADVFGADGVSIMLADAQGELSVRSSRGLPDAAKLDRKRIGEGISGTVAQTGRSMLLSGQVQGGS